MVEYNDELEEAIIVDIDGTLANIGDRSPYDTSGYMDDTLYDAVGSIVNMAYGHGYKVIIVTGRSSEHLRTTTEWLDKVGVNYDEIYTRPNEDRRKDYDIKREIYETGIKDRYNIKFVLEDRPRNVRMFRSLGLTVLDVGSGVEF